MGFPCKRKRNGRIETQRRERKDIVNLQCHGCDRERDGHHSYAEEGK